MNVSRELRRNASTRSYRLDYKASTAQWHAERRARRPKIAKLVANDRLRQYVQDKLSGVVRGADCQVVVGPAGTPWKGRNKPHRGDRAWVTAWSPEQIARRLPVDFPDDETMRISHEAILPGAVCRGPAVHHRFPGSNLSSGSLRQAGSTSASDRTRFSACAGVPEGDQRTYLGPRTRLRRHDDRWGAWMVRSWQGRQTTRVLRRRFAMSWAHAGCGRPGWVRSLERRTWCTCISAPLLAELTAARPDPGDELLALAAGSRRG